MKCSLTVLVLCLALVPIAGCEWLNSPPSDIQAGTDAVQQAVDAAQVEIDRLQREADAIRAKVIGAPRTNPIGAIIPSTMCEVM